MAELMMKYEESKRKIARARELFAEAFCPDCEAPLSKRDEEGHDIDEYGFVWWENFEWECGRQVSDSKVTVECPSKPLGDAKPTIESP